MHVATRPGRVAHESLTARIAANVRAEMARTGNTQTSLSSMTTLSQGALSRRLAGRIPFDLRELEQIAAALKTPVATLLDITEVPA